MVTNEKNPVDADGTGMKHHCCHSRVHLKMVTVVHIILYISPHIFKIVFKKKEIPVEID